MNHKLHGKVAIVTGASKGIGAAIAKALAAEGSSVVVNYASSKSDAEAVVAAIIAAGGKAIAVQGDVSKATEAQGIIDTAIAEYGRLDILVNNAGVYEFSALDAITETHFHKIFNINVLGLILITQAAVKHMGDGGSIINISEYHQHDAAGFFRVFGEQECSGDHYGGIGKGTRRQEYSCQLGQSWAYGNRRFRENGEWQGWQFNRADSSRPSGETGRYC